jgi:hypothetical protein
MLQRHQLLTEFDALFESDKEKYAPFEDIIRAAQVTSATFLLECLPVEICVQGVLILFLDVNVGSNCAAPMGCTCHQAQAWCLGLHSGEC